MKLRLTAHAKRELFRVHGYYERKAPGLGDAFLEDAGETFALILAYPNAWRPLGRFLRRCRLKRVKYGVLYRVYGDTIVVFVVGHLARRQSFWSKAASPRRK